ncbi:hypothetical protein COP2_023676 [Malus domestica]
MSDSSVEKTDGPMTPTPRQPSKAATTPPKELGGGQRQKVFDRLGPQEWTNDPTLARRRLDFNAPFYNEDYYSRNSSSSSSSCE